MDEKFLEFLGNILLSTAKNKQQADQFFQWLQGGKVDPEFMKMFWGKTGTSELAEMFQAWYGPKNPLLQNQQYWQLPGEVVNTFQTSMKDTMLSMGYVPSGEHNELLEKYKKLEEHSKQQEATIRQLKMMLQGQTDMTDQFQNIMSQQGKVYQDFISQFGSLFSQNAKVTTTNKTGEEG